jgi:hypothetical protein
MAYPEAGDFTRHEAPYRGFPVIMERRVLSHDSTTDTFEVSTLTTYRGQVIENHTRTLPRNFLYTPDKISDTLRHCVEREGAISDIRILGRTHRTCEFYNEDSQLTTILGPVPFGQIRFLTMLNVFKVSLRSSFAFVLATIALFMRLTLRGASSASGI